MDSTSIILAVALFAIGLLIGWAVWGRRKASVLETEPAETSQAEAARPVDSEPSTDDGQYAAVIAEKDKKIRQAQAEISELTQKADDLKRRYNSLKAKLEKQVAELESQLQNSTKGKLDDVTSQKLAGLAKLQKQVKDLEDEIDDLEDEADDYKKKLKRKDSELADTQDQLDKIERQGKALKQELDSTKTELSEKNKELDLKAQGIEFVQEILLSKKEDSEDEKRLGQRVDDLKEFILGDFKETVGSIWQIEKDKTKLKEDPVFGNSLDSWAATAKKSWLNKKTTIAFVGEFSAGKTSIVNRILSQDDPSVPLLPVSTKATTAIPTYISGADHPSYRFVTPADEIKALSEKTFKKVNKEVLGQVKGMSNLIKYFVMRYKNPNLSNLSILDTPGFSSNDKEDAIRTIEVINECDALFWVFDVNAGTVNRSSIKLIKDNLTRPLYVVINKVDTKAKVEVDSVEKLIRNTLGNAGIKVEAFIRFSSKAPLQDIMNPILSVRHDSDKDSYLQTVWHTAINLCDSQLKDVQESEKQATELENEYEKLVDDYNESLKGLRDDCEEAAGIPRWEEHLFSKDRFEMDADEGSRLIELLEEISDKHSNDLADGFNKQSETVDKLETAWETSSEEKSKYVALENCVDTLGKKIKSISPNATADSSPQKKVTTKRPQDKTKGTSENVSSKSTQNKVRTKQPQNKKEETLEETLSRLGR